jgi:hypothetical protein
MRVVRQADQYDLPETHRTAEVDPAIFADLLGGPRITTGQNVVDEDWTQ